MYTITITNGVGETFTVTEPVQKYAYIVFHYFHKQGYYCEVSYSAQ